MKIVHTAYWLTGAYLYAIGSIIDVAIPNRIFTLYGITSTVPDVDLCFPGEIMDFFLRYDIGLWLDWRNVLDCHTEYVN